MQARARWMLGLATLLAALAGAAARAHEFKMDAVMNAFVAVEGGEAHLVIRAPLFLFGSSRLPTKNLEIDVPAASAALARAAQAVERDVVLLEDGQRLHARQASARLSLPSDRSFVDYAQARAHVALPPEPDLRIYADQGYVDTHLVYALRSSAGALAIRTTAAPELGDSLKLALRYQRGDAARTMVVTSRHGIVPFEPSLLHAAGGFVRLGMAHIFTGIDHLLFLLCLVIPLRGWRQLVAIVTTFTVAHSFTLLGSAYGLAPSGPWFAPLVEMFIALSIAYMAIENILRTSFERRLALTLVFGLVHGFGFSSAMQGDLQFAGTHLVTALLAFNVGVEAGQLVVLAVMLPALYAVRRYVLRGRLGLVILCALVALTGWQWMLERAGELAKVQWPQPSVEGLLVLVLWIGGIGVAVGLARVAAARMARTATPPDPADLSHT